MDLALNNLQWLICHKTKKKSKQTSSLLNRADQTQESPVGSVFDSGRYNTDVWRRYMTPIC